MKRFARLFICSLFSLFLISCIQYTQATDDWFGWNPMDTLNTVYEKANDKYYQKIEDTALNEASSLNWHFGNKYTLSNTLYRITNHIHSYLQYFVYFWLALAVIFVMLNGLKLIHGGEKEMANFQKNIFNLALWIILLTAFYYIIDIFIALVNLIAKE